MSVYVDDTRAKVGRMVMCHMIADTPEELRGMAATIGVDRKWLRDEDTHREHFDISYSKRKLAVAEGAIEITRNDLVVLVAFARISAMAIP